MKRRVLFFLISVFSFLGVLQSQNGKIDSLKNLLGIEKSDTSIVNILNKLSTAYYDINVDGSYSYADKALTLAQKINFKRGTALAFYNRGFAGTHSGSFQQTKNDFIASEKIYKELKNYSGVAKNLHARAILIGDEGNYVDATALYLSALKMYELAGDERGVASELLNIGVIYNDQGQYSEAVTYEKKAIEKFRALPYTGSLANAMTRLGNTYWNMKDLSTAKILYDSALTAFSSINHKRGVGVVLNNLAGIMSEEGDTAKAIAYYEKALSIRNTLGDKNGVAIILLNLGSIYTDQHKTGKAIAFLNRSLDIAVQIHDKDIELQNLKFLASNYAGRRKFEKAYDYFRKFYEITDSVSKASSAEKVHELNKKYNTEKKDREIELKNVLLQKQSADAEKKSMQRNFLIGGLAVLGVFVFFILRSRKKIQLAKDEVSLQKLMIEQKSQEVTDSIRYASRIQNVLLASEKYIERNLNRLNKNKS